MTYEQYWYGDPLMVRAYYKAQKLREEQADTQAWMNGMYFAKAIEATIMNAFKKRSETPTEYPSMPITIKRREEEREKTEEEKRKLEESETAFAKLWMNNFMLVGKNWGKQ